MSTSAKEPAGIAEDDILTLKEVAYYLNLTERTFCRFTQDKRLPGFKVGYSLRFRLGYIEPWIDAQKAEVQRDGGRR